MTAKTMLKTQFDTIELHAVDDKSYLTIILVTQCLKKYGYVTLSRMKTKTVQIVEEEQRNHNARLQPRLVVHLTKTADFESIYGSFESQFNKMLDEHKEDIDVNENEGGEEESKEAEAL